MTAAVARAMAACLLMLSLCASAQRTGRDAERRLDSVQRELKEVAAERRRIEGQRGAASRELRAVDERVADSSRALQLAETDLARQQDAVQALNSRRQSLREEHAVQRRELATLLRAAYAQGEQAPLKLLLAQDRIADANRQLAYYGYLQRQRVQRTVELTAELSELERVEQQIVDQQTTLDVARRAQQQQLATLARDRQARAVTLTELEQRYRDRSAREQALGSDAQALQQLVARLRAAAAKAAAERIAAERAAARAAAREAAQAKLAAARLMTAKAAASKSGASQQASSQEAASAHRTQVDTAQAKPPRQIANAAPVRVGGFGWPLSGTLVAGFGGRMPDGRASNGLLIAAGLGAPVHAIADGSVVFAEWMTGYGLILIVDHGNGYLSLYAHNESLLKHVGDAVKRGENVARVGNSGGLEQPGLYFELRHDGQPVNPDTWLRRQ